MLFHEMFSVYYLTVSLILREALMGNLTEKRMEAIIRENAFTESILSILPAIKSEEWPVCTCSFQTPLTHEPVMPVSLLERRWLKALLQDPRIALFQPDITGLEDVQPLYKPDDFIVFDKYGDGDPYDDPAYIARFRTILEAMENQKPMHIRFQSGRGNHTSGTYLPHKLEYSSRDDKFRLTVTGKRRYATINLSRIVNIAISDQDIDFDTSVHIPKRVPLVLEIINERNALERIMLHFSNYQKETQRLGNNRYLMTMWYDAEDETEILIRVLAFGPLVKAVSPDTFVEQLKERINRQVQIGFSHTADS